MEKIKNPYFSVELNGDAIVGLKERLKSALKARGVPCEDASASAHVSIAYTEGDAPVQELERIASEITHRTKEGFKLPTRGLEIFEGLSTPFDYLVLSLEAEGAFRRALDVVEGRLSTRRFQGGFKSHVSLLRFKKGALAQMKALCEQLTGECPCLMGERICVYDTNRERFLSLPLANPSLVA